MTILMASCLFIVGLILGSFFNVVGLRVPQKLSIVSPPSSCSHCGTQLKTENLIPVLSWIWAKGRCRYCRQKLSIVYPIGELMTGFLFLWIYIQFGNSWEMILGLLLISLAIIITVSDLTYRLIPNIILLTMSIPVAVVLIVFDLSHIGSHLLGTIIGGLLIALKIMKRKEPMPFGPFLLAGSIIAFVYGESLVSIYTSSAW